MTAENSGHLGAARATFRQRFVGAVQPNALTRGARPRCTTAPLYGGTVTVTTTVTHPMLPLPLPSAALGAAFAPATPAAPTVAEATARGPAVPALAADAPVPPAALAGPGAALVPQLHGGALLPGGQAGNKGGGRPKEALRERSRGLYSATLEQIAAKLSGAALAHDAADRILIDPRVLALNDDVQTVLQTVVREHTPAQLTPGELQRVADTLGKYGLGTQQEVEQNETHRYVVALPARVPLPAHMQNPQAGREVAMVPAPDC